MFQQGIVTKPNFKPAVSKSAKVSATNEDEPVFPLEYFSAYEQELQETILELNSELDCGDCSGTFEGSRPSCSDSEEDESSDDEDCDKTSSGTPQSELAKEANEQQKFSFSVAKKEFDAYESRLQSAVKELSSLSHGLVCV